MHASIAPDDVIRATQAELPAGSVTAACPTEYTDFLRQAAVTGLHAI